MTIQEEIRALAAAKKAVILAHNYTRGEVQDVADYTGDRDRFYRDGNPKNLGFGSGLVLSVQYQF